MKTKFSVFAFVATAVLSFAVESDKRPAAPAQPIEQTVAPQKRERTVAELEADLKVAKTQLAELRTRYMEKHPKMIDAFRNIARLERQIADRK